ncbi:MAG: 50S ribosomal protein L17 [Deferribacterota bacterium]|nr:50S ribosomal protein L17 [Deferribacterota bacterium]
MRHHRKVKYLGRDTDHRYAMLRNLSVSLIENGYVKTTVERAKALRSFIEPLITFGKRGDLSSRRLVLKRLPSKKAVGKLFEKVAPIYKERNGGYTRIVKLSERKGDNAPLALIELVDRDKLK